MEKIFPVSDIIKFCQYAAKNHHGYVWGGRGKIYDKAERNYLYRCYNTTTYNRTYYFTTQWKRWKNTVVYDCSGLFQAFRNVDQTAQGLYDSCKSKTSLSNMKYLPGTLLFVNQNGKMVHVGLYIGCGLCIHCKSSSAGVVIEDVRKHKWTHAGLASWLDYTGVVPSKNDWIKSLQRELNDIYKANLQEDNISGSKTLNATVTVKKGSRGTLVKLIQERLNAFGCDCGEADGVAGTKFETAVKEFQKYYVGAAQEDIDGIISGGKATWKRLLNL